MERRATRWRMLSASAGWRQLARVSSSDASTPPSPNPVEAPRTPPAVAPETRHSSPIHGSIPMCPSIFLFRTPVSEWALPPSPPGLLFLARCFLAWRDATQSMKLRSRETWAERRPAAAASLGILHTCRTLAPDLSSSTRALSHRHAHRKRGSREKLEVCATEGEATLK